MTKEQIKDIAIRTLKTAIAAVITALAVSVENFYGITDVDGLKNFLYGVAITAVMAAVTAIMNIICKLFKNWIDDRKLTKEEIDEALGGGLDE